MRYAWTSLIFTVILACAPDLAHAAQLELPEGCHFSPRGGHNPDSPLLVNELQIPEIVPDGDGSCACPDKGCLHKRVVYSNDQMFKLVYKATFKWGWGGGQIVVRPTLYFYERFSFFNALAMYHELVSDPIAWWNCVYGYPPGDHPEMSSHACGTYLKSHTLSYMGHIMPGTLVVSGSKETESSSGFGLNVGAKATTEKSDEQSGKKTTTGKTVGAGLDTSFTVNYNSTTRTSSGYSYSVDIVWEKRTDRERRAECSCGSDPKPESGLQNPDPTKTVQDPSPFGKTELVVQVLPAEQEKKVRDAVHREFGVTEVVVPVISDEPVSVSAPPAEFGVSTVEIVVIADESAMKQTDPPVQKKSAADGPKLVIDPTKVPELTTVTSTGEPQSRQNQWQRLKFVKVDAPLPADKTAGVQRARNLSDLGTAPVNFSPQTTGTTRIAIDIESAALDNLSRLELLDADQKPLAAFKPDLVVRQGATATAVGPFTFADQAAFDRFTTLKVAPAVLVTRKDGTSTSFPITDVAPKGVRTAKDAPALSVKGPVRPGEDVPVNAVSEARAIERRAGWLSNTVRTIVEQIHPDGSRTKVIDTLNDGKLDGTAKAPAQGTMKFEATYKVDEAASRTRADEATRAMKKLAGDYPWLTDIVPGVPER